MRTGSQTREVVLRHDADEVIAELAGPQVLVAAQVLRQTIPAFVPRSSGVAATQYERSLRVQANEDGSAAVVGLPFLWHWLEYGTRFNAPYRPVENAARSLGLNYQPHGMNG